MTNVVVHLSGATARYSQITHGTRRVLDKLPDAVLKDIGLARSDIPFIGGKLADKCNPRRHRPVRLERGVAECDDPPFARDRLSPHAGGSSHCFCCFRPFIRPGLAAGSTPK